jgi:hypothetical protein
VAQPVAGHLFGPVHQPAPPGTPASRRGRKREASTCDCLTCLCQRPRFHDLRHTQVAFPIDRRLGRLGRPTTPRPRLHQNHLRHLRPPSLPRRRTTTPVQARPPTAWPRSTVISAHGAVPIDKRMHVGVITNPACHAILIPAQPAANTAPVVGM